MQAIILAAGMGKRLKDLTQNSTKCMIKVNDVPLIMRMLFQLEALKLSRIVIVVGYQAENLIEYITQLDIKTPIIYVKNEVYNKTNNIYSLYLAKEHLVREATLLLESDLIFEDSVLRTITENPDPSLALVAKYESWMDGTVVTLNDDDGIVSFIDKAHFKFEDIKNYFKTVNIYKFSAEFSRTQYVPFLEAYIAALGQNEYYEQVLKIILHLDMPGIKAVRLDPEHHWYEIDDVQDLDIAESIFIEDTDKKLAKMSARYGGYWRYPALLDFCYLVNPYYPPQKLLDEMKASFERVICEYPSGLSINNLLAAKYFGLKEHQIVVGNGAAEIIKSLMNKLHGTMGIVLPTFEEYPNRRDDSVVSYFVPKNSDFSYTSDDLIEFFGDKNISSLLLINPDNPSGNYIKKADVLRLADWADLKNIRLIVDESFVDFSDNSREETLLQQDILKKHPDLIVIKSISKSFGVPGLRLGVLASFDQDLMSYLRKDFSIWNINSMGEFFLQIFEKYQSDYWLAIEAFGRAKADFMAALGGISGIRVIPTQANFVMCELTGNISARALAGVLLDKYNILIKDLSRKSGVNGQYIRLAIKLPHENERLASALKEILR